MPHLAEWGDEWVQEVQGTTAPWHLAQNERESPTHGPQWRTLSTPTPRFFVVVVILFCFVFNKLVCISAWGHLILKTRLGKSDLISKGVSAGVEEMKSPLMWARIFSSLCGAQTAAVLMERAMAVMNVQGIFTGLICVHTWAGELSRQNCYFGLLLGYSYSTGNMFKKYFH